MLLEASNITVIFDKAMIINDISMSVDTGELVSIVGPNGAGKSTLLRAITGLVSRDKEIMRRAARGNVSLEGSITFDGVRIDKIPPHEIVKLGLVHCPERRRPFREMTVMDNLLAGAYLHPGKSEVNAGLEKSFELFPVLKKRLKQISGTMSGGEQQMLAIARSMMSGPKLLCIDEPTTGLAPLVRREVFEKITEINRSGITVLLVEQEVSTVFKMTSRNYVLSSGKIIAEGPGEELLKNEVIRKTYLGL